NPYPDVTEDFIHIPTNNESPLFALLSRKAMGLKFNEPMETFANQILSRIPSDLDLLQQDMYFPIKMKSVYDFVKESPPNECQNALLTELNFLVHGQSETSCDVLCLDTWWQHVRFQEGAPPLEQIDHWLGQLAQKRKTDFPAQAQRISQMNVEALVRTLLYDGGFDFVRKKLMLDEIKQDAVQLFSLDDTHVYLEERDKNLPDVICQGWMDGLVQTGRAKMEKDIFMIDWKPMLENKPFSKQGQIMCVNILLSMLNHFGNKTRNDMSRKPLLVGVLKTLFNFLSLSPSYKVAGALILARKVSTVASLQPEIQLIEMDLELRSSQSYNEEQLMETIRQEENVRRRLLLGYHIVSRLPMKEKTELLKMAMVLGACVRYRIEVEDTIALSVDKIRQTYLSLLELDTLNYKDPFPNLSIRHSKEAALESSYPKLPPIPRPNEPTEDKRRRLTYQSRKRGILETDLLLSTFAKIWLPKFDRQQLKEYDQLLDEPDWDIFYWATEKKPIPEIWQKSEIFQLIKQHAKNKDKKVLRMPDLETK
ncbi:succinate dehydrogenase assembly factor 2, partial [Rhizopus stolonifer]